MRLHVLTFRSLDLGRDCSVFLVHGFFPCTRYKVYMLGTRGTDAMQNTKPYRLYCSYPCETTSPVFQFIVLSELYNPFHVDAVCRKCIHDKFNDEEVECCPVCKRNLGCTPVEKLR
jgi:hypothetical protein